MDVFSPTFSGNRKNPTPDIFGGIVNRQRRPTTDHLNVCTGDIHINGLEGPYTMILIDGTCPLSAAYQRSTDYQGSPIAWSNVWRLSRDPSKPCMGSEAVGGSSTSLPRTPHPILQLKADVFATSVGEYNADFSGAGKINTRDRLGSTTSTTHNPRISIATISRM